MATISTSNRQRIDINNPIITRIQVEGNDTVSFLNGTVAPYQYVRGMSQIMPQTPTYISYRYDSITISQVSGDSFTFTIYAVTDVGGNTFTPLTFQDPADVVQAKTIEIYRLLVTAVFKGCCECGNTEPECSIQYTSGDGIDAGTLLIDGVNTRINYFTANNQDFTGFWPIIQDGSWIFIFSKTDPTVYGVFQLSNYSDGGTFAQFDITLLAGTDVFPEGTSLCVDVTSVGGSLVQDWQDTLIISSLLTQNNAVDGGGFNFGWSNVNRYTIDTISYQAYTADDGAGSIGIVQIDPGAVTISGNAFIDIITPNYATATTGMVLALDASGHVEYTLAGTGTISSIGLFMPSAFTVSTPNPLTSNGDFTVTGAGTDLEYINGLGELATLPVYTVENGLHPFGGVPGETPPNPFLFHLGGQLIEDTLIETTEVVSPGVVNEWQLSVRGAGGTDGQNTQFPFGVANLGDGGVATFQDYGSGARPNPSVEIVGDVDLAQPLLELNMAGSLPTADDTLLRLRYTGDPSLAMMTMDYQFRNNNAVVANSNFIGSRLSTEVLNFIDGDEETRFELQLVDGGTLSNKLELQGFGQLILNEYGTSQFSNGTSNIDNDLEYVLAVDVNGKVFKKLSEGGGTVTEVDATGLLTTSPDPITTTGTVTSEMNSGFLVGRYDAGVGVFQEITIGSGLTLTGDTLSADGGGGTYDGDQGVYKDTTLTNDTFMLGAPYQFGVPNPVPFQVVREVDVAGNSMIFTGSPAFSYTLQAYNSSTTSRAGGAIYAEAVNGFQRGVYSNAPAGIGFYTTSGTYGLMSYTTGSDFNTQLDVTPANTSNVSEVLYLNRNNADTVGAGLNIMNRINSTPASSLVTTAQGYSLSTPTSTNFEIQTKGIAVGVTSNLTIKGVNGQIQFNQYGTPGTFYDASPVWALGVDGSGNVVEIDPGGGGGTYTVNNGLTENPTDNFQLGGPLVQNTIITGASNAYDLTFDELNEFYVNGNNKMIITSTNATGDFSKCYVAPPAAQLINKTAGFADSTITAEAGVASMEATPVKILLNATEMQLRTPAVAALTAVNGQVLTLIDAVTGEAEWQNGGSGLKSGNAIQGPPGEYTATISGVTAYTAGEAFMIKFDSTNEGASTLDINSLGPIDIFKNTNVKISSGDIKTDQEIMVVYDGTNFQAIGLVTNQLLAYVHNSEAAPITKGQVVYAFGASGDRMSVKLALANADATSAKTIGMVYDSSIAAGGEGYIIIQGVIEGINTSAFAAGAILYLSGTTPGGYTSTPTYAPTHRVYVGVVEKSNPGNGQIYVRCQNGYELDELHDVQAQSPNDNDTLYFDSADSQWKTGSVPSLSGTFSIGITLDGSGGVITAGQKGYVRVPYACTITSWSILTGNAGLGATVTFDIWRANNAIPTVATPLVGGGTKPFLTSATQQITSAAPTGWTSVTLAANDILGFNVEPGAAVFSWVNLQLLVTKI